MKKRKKIYQTVAQVRAVSYQRRLDKEYALKTVGKIGNNAECSCGSSLKFKNCCRQEFSPFTFFQPILENEE